MKQEFIRATACAKIAVDKKGSFTARQKESASTCFICGVLSRKLGTIPFQLHAVIGGMQTFHMMESTHIGCTWGATP